LTTQIIFGRFKEGEDAPFQFYIGSVSSAGITMAGQFFDYGIGGPTNVTTTPFVGQRGQ
jgi:hypothetical protein